MSGKDLKHYREIHFLTQKQLGMMLGYKPQAAKGIIYRWEADRVLIPVYHMRRLHELIEIPYEKMVP